MLLGYEKFRIDNHDITIEINSCIPDDYIKFDGQKGYDLFRKDENINNDTHHYYVAKRQSK